MDEKNVNNNENNDKNNNKKSVIIVAVLLIAVLLLVISIFMLINSDDDKQSSNSNEVNDSGNVNDNQNDNGYTKLGLIYSFDDYDVEKININLKDAQFDIFINRVDAITEYKINDKVIITTTAPTEINSIYLFDNFLLFLRVGSDIRTQKILTFDFEGNEINIIPKYEFETFLDFKLNESEFKDNKFTLNYSAVGAGPEVMYYDNNQLYNYYVCTAKEDSSYKSFEDNLVVEYTVEFEYLGEGKFSSINVVNEITYSELVNSAGC